jgi:site-specific DNA-methyltransferase (adenine-specific)
MKFDVIVGNPPYQIKVGDSNTEPIWNKFVEKAFQLVNVGGYVSLIHPSGWRSNKGRFNYIKKLILSKNPIFLKLHDFNEGQKVFGVGTNPWILRLTTTM